MSCFFCGREVKLTREHVLPRWMRRPLEDEPRWETSLWFRSSLPVEGSQPLRRRRTDNVLRRVCANCNSGWMSQLEGGVRPLLKDRTLAGMSPFGRFPWRQMNAMLTIGALA